jgi:hypothetical protein
MKTIGYFLSRLRNLIKAVKQDSFLTDRFLYSLARKHIPFLLKREDGRNKLMTFNGIFELLPYVELIEVDRVEAKCSGIKSGCTIKRTKDKLPTLFSGYIGPLIRSITSISGPATSATDEGVIRLITANKYASIVKSTNFKYNKIKYCWFIDGYLYFPDLEWDAVRIEGIFDADISKFNCSGCVECKPRQEQNLNIPEYLYSELESLMLKDLGITFQLPTDPADDKINPLR